VDTIRVNGLVNIIIRPTKKNSIAMLSKQKGGNIIIKNIQSESDFYKNLEKRKIKILPTTPFYFQIFKQVQDENGKWITINIHNKITSQINKELLDLIRPDCKTSCPATESAYILRILDTQENQLLEFVNEENIKKVKDYLDKHNKVC
jgi:hypothetical protein